LEQAMGDPFRNGNAHRIADHLPSETLTTDDTLCRQSPVGRETLEPFCIAEIWHRDQTFATTEPYCRRRRDSDGGTSLERRHRILCGTKTPVPLCPVKTKSLGPGCVGENRRSIAVEQHLCRILRARCQQKNPLPPLWKAEGHCVNRTVRPSVSKIFKRAGQEPHGMPAPKPKHERHILKKYPTRGVLVGKKPKHLADKTRVSSFNARSLSCLAQVLARKARHNHINSRKATKRADVTMY
jgi:hypothetical protein